MCWNEHMPQYAHMPQKQNALAWPCVPFARVGPMLPWAHPWTPSHPGVVPPLGNNPPLPQVKPSMLRIRSAYLWVWVGVGLPAHGQACACCFTWESAHLSPRASLGRAEVRLRVTPTLPLFIPVMRPPLLLNLWGTLLHVLVTLPLLPHVLT